ncbi:beta galactofuranosyl glycosyltransferase, putative, partial [Trypanosoma cruzi marinkellei]
MLRRELQLLLYHCSFLFLRFLSHFSPLLLILLPVMLRLLRAPYFFPPLYSPHGVRVHCAGRSLF